MLPSFYKEAIDYSTSGDLDAALPLWKKHFLNLSFDTDVLERYFVHYYLADALGEKGELEKAIQILKDALKKLPESEDDLILSTQVEMCRFLVLQGSFEEADKLRKIFWSKLLQEERLTEAFYTARDKFAQHTEVGDILLDEVINHAVKIEHLDFLNNFYRDYAAHLLSQKRFEDILELSKKVKSLLANSEDTLNFQDTIIYTYLNEFEVYYQISKYDLLKESLFEFKNKIKFDFSKDIEINVLVLFYEAIEFLIEEDILNSLELFKEAKEYAGKDKKLQLLVIEKTYQALSEFYFYEQARPFAHQAISLANESDDEYAKLDMVVDLAQIEDSANNFRKAIDVLMRIESQVIAHGDQELTQRFYSLLTKSSEQLPDAKIFDYARLRWKEIGEELPDHLAFDFYFDYAQVLINLNQSEKALEYYERAELIALNHKWEHFLPHVYVEMAICESRLNRHEEGYHRLKKMTPPVNTLHLYATYLNLMADCQYELGMDEEAISNYNKCIELVGSHPYFFHYASSSYSNLGLIEHFKKNYLKAEQLYLKGLETDKKSGITQQEITACYNLGVLYVDWKQYQKAEKFLWTSLNLISNTYGLNTTSSDQKNIMDEWFTVIELLVEVLVEQDDKLNALRLLLNKQTVLSGLKKESLNTLPLPQLSPKQQLIAYSGIRQERMFIFQLFHSLPEQPLEMKVTKVELNDSNENKISDALQKAVERFKKRTLKNVGERDKNYQSPYPWMIRYTHFLCAQSKRFQTPKSIQLKNELFDVFSKILIAPLGEISDTEKIVISPNYILGAFPFSALHANENKKQRLIVRFELSIFGGFTNEKFNPSNSNNVLIFGATKYAHSTNLTDLPAARIEVEKISSIFPKSVELVDDPTIEIIGKVNNEILKNNPSFLHFIGHAEDSYPESVLYYPYADKGIIPISEIMTLKLSGITVYLSACSSANGSAYAGWGIDSVARSFLRAGASHIISLLFPLSDELSPLIVEAFYKRLKLGSSPETALSEVQGLCIDGKLGVRHQEIQCWGSLICIKSFAVLQ